MMRARDRQRKQRSRSNLSTPQKNKIRQYDRARKSRCLFPDNDCGSSATSPSPSYSRVQKKSKLIRDILGSDPVLYTDVLAHVIQKSVKSPRKQKLLEERLNFITSPKAGVDSELRKIAVLKTKKRYSQANEMISDLKKQHGSVSQIASQSVEGQKFVYRLLSSPNSRKKEQESYVRKISDVMKEEVMATYNDEEVSYDLPDRKAAGLKFMSVTIEEAYQIYLQKSESERKVARSTFMNMKPDYVRTIGQTPIRGCKCEYCTNFGFLRETLIGKGFKGIPKNHSAAIEVTWCEFRNATKNYVPNYEPVSFEEMPKKECVTGRCPDCGVDKYRAQLEELNSGLLAQNSMVTWKQWEYTEASTGRKSKTTDRKMGLVSYSGTITELLDKYIKCLKDISTHQFSKLWQMKQFKLCKSNLRNGQVLLILDFSQNLLLYSNPEPSACHWDHQQVTIHPVVCYYRCPDENCDEMVVVDLIHITGDRRHDVQAAYRFEEASLEYLRRNNIPIEELHEFTDQCSQQFKSCIYFFFLSVMKLLTVRHYFGVRHGKSPSDRAGANFKRFVKQAIKPGNVHLRTIDELVHYSTEHYEKDEKHRKIKIMFHPRIERDTLPKYKPFPGTRKLHSVRSFGTSGVVEKRNISCCCKKCQNGEGECAFPQYTDQWHRFSVVFGGLRKKELAKLKSHWDRNNQAEARHPNVTHERAMNEINIDPAVANDQSITNSNDQSVTNSNDHSVTNNVTVMEPSPATDKNVMNDNSVRQNSVKEKPVTKSKKGSSQRSVFKSKFWKDLYDKINSVTEYDDLVSIIRQNVTKLPPLVIKMKRKMSSADVIDRVAHKFYPRDGPDGLVPVSNIGDGNCLPRALAHLFLQSQDDHPEVRIRMTFEGTINESIYVSDDYLGRGLIGPSSQHVASSYCMYSGIPITRRNSPEDILRIYRQDLMTVRRLGTEMGLWQFHIATQIFSRAIGTVYPERTNPFLRKHTNRIILPLRESLDIREPVYVMWTPTKRTAQPYDVKHFVPLMEYESLNFVYHSCTEYDLFFFFWF